MICPYVELNNTQHKCIDYYITYKGVVKCRLKEWKRRRKVCPYDRLIFSVPKPLRKASKDKAQERLI